MITAEYLRPGDKIAIISPATEIKPEYIDGAIAYISGMGYTPVEMPHARGPRCGTYACGEAERTDDFLKALFDSEIRMIFCARGGYGCVQLLNKVDPLTVRLNPKWLLGFSDISVLHSLWLTAGVRSIHASMAKQLSLFPDSPLSRRAFEIAEGKLATQENPEVISAPPHPGNISGVADGITAGGNLAVIDGLASTPFDIFGPEQALGKILFFEDVGEKIYRVERMLTRLYLAGTLQNAAGLVFGRFTDYLPDRNFNDMETMIGSRLHDWNILTPAAVGFPIGHIDDNQPVPEGWRANLTVGAEGSSLTIF